MNTTQRCVILLLFLLALGLRVFSLHGESFYCDVPASEWAVESGALLIQFPGYAPYHLLVRILTGVAGSAFGSLTLLSLLCGMGAMGYVVRFAADRSGFAGALVASVIMGGAVLPLYFSCVGASYATDLLCASAMLYHGSRFLQHARAPDYNAALGWYAVGCLLRPLTFTFLGLAIVYLLARQPTRARLFVSVGLLMGAAIGWLAISLPYYGSAQNLWAATAQVRGELQPLTLTSLATNSARLVIYPLWSFHILIVVTAVALWRQRGSWDIALGRFLLLMMVPYGCILVRYIPHAGYYCVLVPALVALPWVAGSRLWFEARPVAWSVVLAVLFLCQWMIARPIETRGGISLVANVYALQYSRAGIRLSMFETLTSLSDKTGVLRERIPAGRLDRMQKARAPLAPTERRP